MHSAKGALTALMVHSQRQKRCTHSANGALTNTQLTFDFISKRKVLYACLNEA